MSKRKLDDGGLGEDPLDGPLIDTLYRRVDAPREETAGGPPPPRGRGHRRPLREGQTHRLVTFSFYEDDVELLDRLLDEARARGVRGASRSLIVRLALRQVDLDALKDRL